MTKGFFTTTGTPALLKSRLLASPHAFTTRIGGVSGGIFDSLNLGENRGDSQGNVRRNYEILADAMGFELKKLVSTRQVHGNTVRAVTEADSRELFSPVPYEADGLVTNLMNLPIMIFTADCVPILLEDPVNKVIAAVHAGWRSTVADILNEALRVMRELGADISNIRAAIGPAIGDCCFEVGSEVPDAVKKLLGKNNAQALIHRHKTLEDKFFVDLRGANRLRLIQLGVPDSLIDVSSECTRCNHETYWSHRHTDGKRGSQGAVIYQR